jgi:hypothetical protein
LGGHLRKVSVVKVFHQQQIRLGATPHTNKQISFLYFSNIGLMQCSQTLSVISPKRIEKRTIGAIKLHQHFEFGPASQDPFSFCQIQLALDTVQDIWVYPYCLFLNCPPQISQP